MSGANTLLVIFIVGIVFTGVTTTVNCLEDSDMVCDRSSTCKNTSCCENCVGDLCRRNDTRCETDGELCGLDCKCAAASASAAPPVHNPDRELFAFVFFVIQLILLSLK